MTRVNQCFEPNRHQQELNRGEPEEAMELNRLVDVFDRSVLSVIENVNHNSYYHRLRLEPSALSSVPSQVHELGMLRGQVKILQENYQYAADHLLRLEGEMLQVERRYFNSRASEPADTRFRLQGEPRSTLQNLREEMNSAIEQVFGAPSAEDNRSVFVYEQPRRHLHRSDSPLRMTSLSMLDSEDELSDQDSERRPTSLSV